MLPIAIRDKEIEILENLKIRENESELNESDLSKRGKGRDKYEKRGKEILSIKREIKTTGIER